MPRDRSLIFATALRAMRQDAGMSQRDLGERSGVSAAAISRIEAGERTPTLGTVCALSEALRLVVVVDEGHLTIERRSGGGPDA